MRRPRKQAPKPKAAEASSEANGGTSSSQAAAAPPAPKKREKRPRAPEPEPEYLPDRRNLEDLWQAAFPVGTEWENMDKLGEINWNFSNLEEAFEEGGALHGKTTYLFGCTEPQFLSVNGERKMIIIPVVVAVVSPIPPSDKIGIKSIQREKEDIVPMKTMKMGWVPYIPLDSRHSQVDKLKTQIFTLGCTQRRSALKFLKTERVRQYDYCLPYFEPLEAPQEDDDTVVNILYPLEPPIVCDYDWQLDDYEDFASDLVKDGALPEDEKEKFKNFVKDQVRGRKKELKEAKEARKKRIEEMDPTIKEAFQNMRFLKFYPVKTPETPDVSSVKVSYINRYYGKAHELY